MHGIYVDGVRVKEGTTLICANGYRADVMSEPILNWFGGWTLDLDYSPPGCSTSTVDVDLDDGAWHILENGLPVHGLEIISVEPTIRITTSGHYTPQCTCSMAWCDSDEKTWPHSKGCQYVKYMQNKREEAERQRRADEIAERNRLAQRKMLRGW